MRKIKIENSSLDLDVICPLVSGVGKDIDGMSLLHVYCTSDCAWFHIETEYGKTGTTKDKTINKLAYCKDHCIGEIVE